MSLLLTSVFATDCQVSRLTCMDGGGGGVTSGQPKFRRKGCKRSTHVCTGRGRGTSSQPVIFELNTEQVVKFGFRGLGCTMYKHSI